MQSLQNPLIRPASASSMEHGRGGGFIAGSMELIRTTAQSRCEVARRTGTEGQRSAGQTFAGSIAGKMRCNQRWFPHRRDAGTGRCVISNGRSTREGPDLVKLIGLSKASARVAPRKPEAVRGDVHAVEMVTSCVTEFARHQSIECGTQAGLNPQPEERKSRCSRSGGCW